MKKRYYVVEEYYGIRVYDSKKMKEYYYNNKIKNQIIKMLDDNYNLIKQKKDKHMSAPLKISMNITKNCNLKCIQCFSNSGQLGKNELNTSDIYRLFENMNKNGTFFICLGGGEPFTRNDLFDILEYGKKKQLAISIVSNGLLLNKEKIKKLNEMDLDYLWISFEGLKENHEKLRGKGTFDRTIEKLQLINDYYKGKTALRMSINKYNINEIEDLVQIAEKYNIDLIRFTPLLSFGRAAGKNLTLNQEQYKEFLKNVKKINSRSVEIIYPNMPNNKFWIGTNGFGCHCGKEAIWIDEEGNVSPCIFWGKKYNLGNIKDSNYMDLWNKSLEMSSLKGNNTCKNCKNYKICRGGCRARCLFELNNLNDIDPLCPLERNKKK